MRLLFTSFILSLFCFVVVAQQNDSIVSKGLGEIEISANLKPSTTLSSTPLQVITDEEILKQGIQSVSDAMRRFSGVVLKDYGGIGGMKTVSIRGMGAEYTAISYDGMVVNNLQSGQVDIGRFTLDNISMLSLSIGQTDDIFLTAKSFTSTGILNLQTRKPKFTKDNKNLLHTKVTTGSFGHFEPMIDYAYKVSDRVSLTTNVNWQRADGRYSFRQKDDQRMTNRKRGNSDTDILRSEINLYSKLGNTDNLDVKLYYFDSERGLPGSIILYNYQKKDRLWDKNAFAQITYNKLLSKKWKWKSIAKYDYLYQKYKLLPHNFDATYNRYRQHEVYWSNVALYQIAPSLTASLAQDLGYNSLRSEFPSFNDSRSEPDRYSSFTAITTQYKTDRLTVTASGLNTYVKEEVKGKDNATYKKLSPALSASFKAMRSTNLRLRASYKHLYRIPTFSELYYISTGRSLKPESSSQYNVGATWVGNIKNSPVEYVSITVDGYYNDVKDKIIIVPDPAFPVVLNKGKVEMKGIDAKISTLIRIHSKIELDLNGTYSYMNAYNAEKKEDTYKGQLRYTPKHSGSVTLTVNNPWANLSYSILASGNRYAQEINTADYKLDSYTEHSISLYKEMEINQHKLYASGSILNLLNENYNIIAYYPMPRRSFKISVGCKF